MNRYRSHRLRGFGLLELVVYLGVTAVLAAASFGFLSDVLRTARKTTAVSESDHAVRVVAARLLHEVRSADGIVDASSAFGTDAGRLALATPSGTVTFSVTGAGVLTVTDEASVTAALTPSGVRVRAFRVDPVAVADPASPRSLRFLIEAESARDARGESGALVRSQFAASLR